MDAADGSLDQTGYLKDFAANQDVAIADLVGDNLAGKAMTLARNSLTAGLAASPNPSNTTFIKGQTGVKSVGFNFTAGDAGDITTPTLATPPPKGMIQIQPPGMQQMVMSPGVSGASCRTPRT
jgi:hypothetical protein